MRFFFSSRRRHTRLTCDWSSDVCSSDLSVTTLSRTVLSALLTPWRLTKFETVVSRLRSEERRVGKSVDLGGRRIIKKKNKRKRKQQPAAQGWMSLFLLDEWA